MPYLRLKCTKFDFGPDPAGAPPQTLLGQLTAFSIAGLVILFLRGRRQGGWEGSGGKGK